MPFSFLWWLLFLDCICLSVWLRRRLSGSVRLCRWLSPDSAWLWPIIRVAPAYMMVNLAGIPAQQMFFQPFKDLVPLTSRINCHWWNAPFLSRTFLCRLWVISLWYPYQLKKAASLGSEASINSPSKCSFLWVQLKHIWEVPGDSVACTLFTDSIR